MPEHRELPPYRADAGLDFGIGFGVVIVAVVVVLATAIAVAHRDLASIAARDQAIAQTRHCGLPQHPGDRVVLVVHNRAGQLVATCTPIVDPMAPERGIKP